MKLVVQVGLNSGQIVLDGDPAKGAQLLPQFLAHVYWCQTAGWIKMPLGMHGDRLVHVCVSAIFMAACQVY